jgi:glycosyltransferase involved in cell wall biosynthesis
VVTGHLDEPPEGAAVPAVPLTVRGWHLCDGQPVLGVAVRLDGRLVAVAGGGSERRDDVAAVLGRPEAAAAGWRTRVDLTGPERQAVLQLALIVGPDGGQVDLPPVRLAVRSAAGLHGQLDPLGPEPLDPGWRRVSGWALDGAAPVDTVEVVVAGRAVSARCGLDRQDADGPGAGHAAVSGFEAVVDLGADGERSSVELEVRATAADGRQASIARRVVEIRGAAPAPPGPLVSEVRPTARRLAADHLNLVAFTHHLGLGGGQLWLSELLRRAGAGRDFACTVVAPEAGPLAEEMSAAGIDVHLSGPLPMTDGRAYEDRLSEMAAFVAARGHNAVLVNSFGSFAGADMATRTGLPCVWALHESWPPPAWWSVAFSPGTVDPAIPALVAVAMRRVGALVFEAEATRRLYVGGAEAERTAVVPYGVDTAGIAAYCEHTSTSDARRHLDLPPSARVLLVMGTIEPRKGQTVLASAFAEVAAAHPDTLLAYVGDTGSPYAAALHRLVEDLGIGSQVRIVAVGPDIYPWYRAADVLVCASDVESLPRSVLEAMCFGCPILATATFGLPELLTDGDTGYLFEPLRRSAAVEALRRVLATSPDELRRVGERGQALARARHDSSGYARQVLALLEGLRARPDARPAELLASAG